MGEKIIKKGCALLLSIMFIGNLHLTTNVYADEFEEPIAFVEADIYVYENARTEGGRSGCTMGESNIGSCINLDDINEQYLCDFVNHKVYIARCKNADCTDCDAPIEDYYGYINNQCRNGFLKAKCTDVPWESKGGNHEL